GVSRALAAGARQIARPALRRPGPTRRRERDSAPLPAALPASRTDPLPRLSPAVPYRDGRARKAGAEPPRNPPRRCFLWREDSGRPEPARRSESREAAAATGSGRRRGPPPVPDALDGRRTLPKRALGGPAGAGSRWARGPVARSESTSRAHAPRWHSRGETPQAPPRACPDPAGSSNAG